MAWASKRVALATELAAEGYGPNPDCLVEVTVAVIGGRWKPMILQRLEAGPLHYGELRRRLPGVTQRVLTEQLRALVADGVVRRECRPGPHSATGRVEYAMTAVGISLVPVLEAMGRWGAGYTRPAAPTA